ncbi:hypothetical protein WN51_06559 [Melipona quadrifasciata]|uniref:Uncharacterized protein n=1 Tax=Melipona quadrifasciata TaxID=166423 RepID=A0A0M8ZR79_9HYME|nr:hypothetical protein WN51_06559 [Melipona quadrifasciata]
MYYRLSGAIQERIESSQASATSSTARPQRLTSASPATFDALLPTRLPSIPLPEFHDSLGEWVCIRDSFDSLVNRNESLSNIDLFYYLRTAVKGEPARALKTLPVSDSNYDAAWELLRKRYEGTNQLVDHHLDALFDLPVICQESSSELRKLLDDINNHTKALTSLGQMVDQRDAWLIRLVVRKLDTQTRREWRKRVSETDRAKTLSDLTDFLKQQYRFLTSDSQPREIAPSTSRRFISQRERKPATALNATEVSCPLCSDNHLLSRCESFNKLAIECRRESARDLHVCLNCLRPGASRRQKLHKQRMPRVSDKAPHPAASENDLAIGHEQNTGRHGNNAERRLQPAPEPDVHGRDSA